MISLSYKHRESLCISSSKKTKTKTKKPQQLPKEGHLVKLPKNHALAFIATHITQLFDNFSEKMLSLRIIAVFYEDSEVFTWIKFLP